MARDADDLPAEASGPTLPAGESPPAPRQVGLATVDSGLYEVGEEIARGGLGRVLAAHDRRLDRPVAIKELLREGDDPQVRFAREALLTARLQHPAIVPVYEAGRWPSGAPFYAMKLVSGRSLEDVIHETVTLDERLGLLPHVIHVAEALAYAHDQRIIHRDLKPANVLVGAFGETVVIDWGLAKDLSDPSQPDTMPPPTYRITDGHTIQGSVLGTPAYMPPEQAHGLPVDETADVYSLGALLYHLLAGEPAYSGRSSEDILLKVVLDPPEALERKEPRVPPDLVAIVRKAMARDADARYPTARELAEDLNRFQRGQLVSAHLYSSAERVGRFLRRHRAAVGVAAAMLLVGAVAAGLGVRRIVEERDVARGERAEAQRARDEADQRGDELAVVEASALLDKDPRMALAWLKRLSRGSSRWPAARVIAADAVARGVPRRVIADLSALALAFSPDGKLLACAEAEGVVVVDAQSSQRLVLKGRAGEPSALAFSPDGGKLAFAGARGAVVLWDRQVRASSELLGHQGEVTALAFGPGRLLASASRDGSVRLWDVGSGQPGRALLGHEGEVLAVAFAPDGATLASAGADGTIRLWSAGGPAGRVLYGHQGAVARIAFTPDGGRLVSLGADRSVRSWDLASGEGVLLGTHRAAPARLAMAPDGRWLATAGADGELHLWELATGADRALAGHEDEVTALAFSADSHVLVSAGRDRSIRVWDVRDGSAGRRVGHEGDVTAIALSPDGRTLVSAARDKTVRFWEVKAGGSTLYGHAPGLRALAFSPTGDRLASAGDDQTVRLWDAKSGRARTFAGHTAAVRALAFAPDGRTLASAGEDGTLRLWPVSGPDDGGGRVLARSDDALAALAFSPDGRFLAAGGLEVRLYAGDSGDSRVLPAAPGAVTRLAFSPDGSLLAEGSAAGAVHVVEVPGGHDRVVAHHARPVTSLAFSADGKTLYSASGEADARAVVLATGAEQAPPGLAAPLAVAPSPDGTRVASAGADGAIRLCETASGRCRALAGHQGDVRGLAWAPDGRTLASAGADGTVRLWPDDLSNDPTTLAVWLEGATEARVGD